METFTAQEMGFSLYALFQVNILFLYLLETSVYQSYYANKYKMLKVTLLHGCFLNCANNTKLPKTSNITCTKPLLSEDWWDLFTIVLSLYCELLKRFRSLFWRFHCWLWTSKCRLVILCNNNLLVRRTSWEMVLDEVQLFA